MLVVQDVSCSRYINVDSDYYGFILSDSYKMHRGQIVTGYGNHSIKLMKGSIAALDLKGMVQENMRNGYIVLVAIRIANTALERMVKSGSKIAEVKCKRDVFISGNMMTKRAVIKRMKRTFICRGSKEIIEIYHSKKDCIYMFIKINRSATLEERRIITSLAYEAGCVNVESYC